MKCPLWGGQMYDITHADDVVRETDKSPTLNARMGTGGNQVPILMGDIPSEEDMVVLEQESGQKLMSTTGGQNSKAYAIGNGQVHQLYLQDNCGALNCMQDRMKVMQEVDGGNISV